MQKKWLAVTELIVRETQCIYFYLSGENVQLDGAYVWDDVTIDNNCAVKTAVLDTGVHVYRNTTLLPGCVLAARVRLGFTVMYSLSPSNEVAGR